MKYSIDTSALLEGWRRFYPPDVFPALWEKLEELIESGELRATEEVFHEIERKDDELHKWVRDHANMFIPLDEQIQIAVLEILQDHKRLLDTRKNRSGADPFVIALAKLEACTVVTNERATNSENKPNIPDVCSALGIRAINLLELIREQGWIFRS